jgi:hypothetical protein
LEEIDTFRNFGTILTQNAMPLRIGRWLARTFVVEASYCTQCENLRLSYLLTPVVGVPAGVRVAPGLVVSAKLSRMWSILTTHVFEWLSQRRHARLSAA